MTKLIYRSGLRSIGGTVIELIEDNHRLVFDFGTAFSGSNQQELNPQVEGIYDNTSDYDDMVLISHLHLDHTKAMNLVSSEIPVVMSKESLDFANDLYEIGFTGFLGDKREYRGVDFNITFKHGNIEITFLEVNHNVPGSSAILIRTQDLSILYSGDICLHGRNQQAMPELFKYLENIEEIDIYISEGVSISFVEEEDHLIASKHVDDVNLESNFPNLVQKELRGEEVIYVNPYIMDMDRIKSIIDLAKLLNRELILTSPFAKLVQKYYPECSFKLLGVDEFNVGVKTIDYQQIDESMIVFFDYQDKDKYPKANSAAMLQVGGEPLGDFDHRWQQYQNYLKEQNYTLYKLGSGGHATPENLLYVAEKVDAKYTMPLHSFKPELLKSDKINQLLPIENKTYKFKQHQLID